MAQIPLRRRDGSIRAWALVDDADFDWLNQWKWSYSGGYAARSEYVGWDAEKGYYVNHQVRMHRAIMGLVRGDGLEVDHDDRDRLNNRRANLTILTPTENKRRPKRIARGDAAGVYQMPNGRFRAFVSLQGTRTHLGYYSTEVEAKAAVRGARALHDALQAA